MDIADLTTPTEGAAPETATLGTPGEGSAPATAALTTPEDGSAPATATLGTPEEGSAPAVASVPGQGSSGGGSTQAPYPWQRAAWTPKSAAYTAVAGDQILADTSGGAFTLTLPAAPNVGDQISIEDAQESFAANNLSVDPGGNEIESTAGVAAYSTDSVRLYFVWVGGGIGWRVVTMGAASGGNAGRQLLLTNSAAQPIGDGQTIQLFFDTVTQNDFGGAPWDNGTGYLVLPAGSYVLTLTVFFSGGGSAFFFYGYFSTESNLVALNLNSGNTGAGGFGGTAIPQLFKTDGSANLSMVAYQSGGGGGVSISGPTNYGLSVIQIA